MCEKRHDIEGEARAYSYVAKGEAGCGNLVGAEDALHQCISKCQVRVFSATGPFLDTPSATLRLTVHCKNHRPTFMENIIHLWRIVTAGLRVVV